MVSCDTIIVSYQYIFSALVENIEEYRTKYASWYELDETGDLYTGTFRSKVLNGNCKVNTPNGEIYKSCTNNEYEAQLYNMLNRIGR